MLAMDLLQQVNPHAEDSIKFEQPAVHAQAAHDRQRGCSVTQQQQTPLQWPQHPKQRPFNLSGRTNSASSTFSSEPVPDPALGDLGDLFAPNLPLQLQAQPSLSRDPSCQSNELGALLDSNVITQHQLQQHLRQQPGQDSSSAQQEPALVPIMLQGQLSVDNALQPQHQQLLRQLSNSTQHSQHSQPGASTSGHAGSPAGDEGGMQGGAGLTSSPANSSQTPAGADEDLAAESGKYSLPVAHLKVACGDMVGTLLVHKARIRIYEGTDKEKEVSPTEFERLGGRSATKKWKQSIRLIGEDGGNGRPVGEWYVQMGLEAPKKPRDKDIHNAASTAGNVYLDRHDRHLNRASAPAAASAAAAAAAAAAAPTPRTRPLRAARHLPAADKGKRGKAVGDEGAAGGSNWEDPAAAAAAAAYNLDAPAASLGAAGAQGYAADALGTWGALYQQQHGLTAVANLAATSSLQFQPGANPLALAPSDPLTTTEDPAVVMDAAAADWSQQQQMEATAAVPAAAAATAYAAAMSGEYAVVPVVVGQGGLPGDTSLAVVEMGAYLQGLRSTPPWRLLPINQRPLVGRQLVPLRQLFVMMLHLGGYHNLEGDERLWQELAIQLELPAWPTPEIPDPIRILQQVYRDYLLRFEARYALQPVPPGTANGSAGAPASLTGGSLLPQAGQLPGAAAAAAAAGGSGGGSGGIAGPFGRTVHSPALSTATTQYNAAVGAAASGAGAMMAGLATALTNFSGVGDPAAVAAALNRAQAVQAPSQGLQTAVSGIGDVFLDRSLSGDILEVLADLIPMPPDADTAAAAAAREAAVGSGSSGSGSGNGSSAPERLGSLTLVQAMAAQELAARQGRSVMQPAAAAGGMGVGGTAGSSAVARQHPEMTQLQRRRQQQQLLQQLQMMASEVTAGAFAGGPGPAAGAPAAAAAAAGVGGTRLKRPPPLIRCGDSDLVNLMDQVDVERILREHEEQQQAAVRQGGSHAMLAAPQQHQGLNNMGMLAPAAGAAAAGAPGSTGGLAEALDADMQDMLEGYLHDAAQQQQQQLGLQQPSSSGGGRPQARPAEDAVSGMLESLQIEAQQQQQQQQQRQQQQQHAGQVQLGLPPLQHQLTGEFLPQQYKLHMQQSVGAHLMSDLLSQQQGGAAVAVAPIPGGGSSAAPTCPAPQQQANTHPGQQQQQQQQPRSLQALQQQHQQQADDTALPGFAGGLLRLTTPNSALLGSVLDSPTHRAPGGPWLDGHPQDGQQQQQQRPGGTQAPAGDDLSALMTLW